MRHYVLIQKTLDDNAYWNIPVLGTGYYHNISLTYYGNKSLAQVLRFSLGSEVYRRQDFDVVQSQPNFFKGSNDRNWFVLIDPDYFDGDSGVQIFHAFRKRPLYCRYGDDLHLLIDQNDEISDTDLFVLEMEFVPFYNSLLKYAVMMRFTTDVMASNEDFDQPILLPVSVREGMVEVFAYGKGTDTQEDLGFVYVQMQRPGVQLSSTKLQSGYGFQDIAINSNTYEAIGGGGSLKRPVIIGNLFSGKSSEKINYQLPESKEGMKISFDFDNISNSLDHVFLSMLFVLKVRYAKRSLRGNFLEGSYVTNVNNFVHDL